MYNRPPLFTHQANQLTTVTNRMLIRRYAEHTASQSDDFLFRNTRGILIHKEVKLHLAAVNVAVIVHHHGLHTTANHFADNLGYANRLLTYCIHCIKVVTGI